MRSLPNRARRHVTRALLASIAAGCAGADADGDWAGTVETLPNGMVRVTNPAQGVWPEDGGWRLAPELVLGAVEGEGAQVFSAISGLEVGADGRLYVLDRQANELRIFGPDGAHLRTVGRSGEGPGEYANANGLGWLAEDSLVVVDQRGNRYSVLTKDGEYVRSVMRALGFYGWVFTGRVLDGRVYEQGAVGRGEDRSPGLLVTPLDAAEPAHAAVEGEAPARPVLAGTPDTVLLPVHDVPAVQAFEVRSDRGGMVMGVPFTPRAIYHVDDAGSIWHGWGGELRILRSTFEGDTTLEILLAGDPVPVTEAELEEWRSSAGPRRFTEAGGQLDMARIPDVKPYFDGIHVAPDGHVWIAVPGAPDEAAFMILDPEGRYLGRLTTPGVSRDVYLAPIVRDDRLYLVGRDQLDVQHVYVFRIARSGTAG